MGGMTMRFLMVMEPSLIGEAKAGKQDHLIRGKNP